MSVERGAPTGHFMQDESCGCEMLADLDRILSLQRAAHLAQSYPSAALRRERLDRLLSMILDGRESIQAAISADFGNRSKDETLFLEILSCDQEIRHTRKHLTRWMKRERRPVALTGGFGRAEIIRQPLGAIGIVVPWNYPLYLGISPLAGALAAGNRVILKMSEFTPRFSALFAELIAKTFRPDEVVALTGDAEFARAFVTRPFDHILFTGSTHIGRQVMLAAAPNLTPVTLELGGKSPTIVAPDADMERVATQVMFGKLLNAGQTCVAPDYVLLPRGREQAFIASAREAVMRHYPTLEQNPDYTCIINERQAQRLRRYIDDARQRGATLHPLHDETTLQDSRKLVPLAIGNVSDEMLVMREEIFGPLLPIVPYDSVEQAIEYVNCRPRPLALYLFTNNTALADRVLHETISGGVVINDVMLQVVQNDLPFGGVGQSGMGQYHGKEGFDTFSKQKGVFRQSRVNGMFLTRPPFADGRLRRLVDFLLR